MRPRPFRVLALGLMASVPCVPAAPAQVLDAIVARIDQGVVTWSEVSQERALLRLEGAPEPSLEPDAVADALIRRRLLVAEARKLRLEVATEAVGGEVGPLVARGGEGVLPSLQEVGLDRSALERRARERRLMNQYLGLRREMTFVPESEIRKSYAGRSEGPGQSSLSEARDQLRAELAEKAFQQELDQWIDRQITEGRVVRNPLPSP